MSKGFGFGVPNPPGGGPLGVEAKDELALKGKPVLAVGVFPNWNTPGGAAETAAAGAATFAKL